LIAAVLGTTAELIKISPVLNLLEERGNRVEIWNTSMHTDDLTILFDRLVPGIEIRSMTNPSLTDDVATTRHAVRWIGRVFRNFFRQRRELRRELMQHGPATVLILGDTLTTVIGGIMGRLLRVPVAHIEAGYRSGKVFSPFPEELSRRIVARLAKIHFAPGEQEAANLARRSGRVINTGENTAIDALRSFAGQKGPTDEAPRYGVVTLHRFELMRRPVILRSVLEACRSAAAERPVLFFTGPHGRVRLEEHGLLNFFDDKLVLRDRLPHPDFVAILSKAEFVLTDSGGLQLESSYLGLPCLIFREQVESIAGLDRNIIVSGYDLEVVGNFLNDPSHWRRPSLLDSAHPSQFIVESLSDAGRAI